MEDLKSILRANEYYTKLDYIRIAPTGVRRTET